MMKQPGLTCLLFCLLCSPYGMAASVADREAILQERIDELDARISRLRDISDIEKLQRNYGYYLDKQQWFDLADLFTENGRLEIGGHGIFVGRDRITDYFRLSTGPVGPRRGILNDHLQLQGIITLQRDGRQAMGRWSELLMDNSNWGDLTHENAYLKEDGVWKISGIRARYNMIAPVTTGWAEEPLANTRPGALPSPPDLPPSAVYLTFPGYYNEPFHYLNPVTGLPAPQADPAAGGARFGE